jgi:hypothetical protein
MQPTEDFEDIPKYSHEGSILETVENDIESRSEEPMEEEEEE